MTKINLSAWREILARIFDGFDTQFNVTPDWLINPDTNRRLKLDLLYPDIGLAVRFEGLRAGKQRRRPSLDEELQEKQRAYARETVCREHGVSLAQLNLSTTEPREIFIALEDAMSRATRMLAKDESRPLAEKTVLLEKLSRARTIASQLRRDVKTEAELNTFSALWHDRQFLDPVADAPETPSPMPQIVLKEGMTIEHTHFGEGVVEAVFTQGDDTMVTVDFFSAGRRTFLANLLADKISIIT